MATNNLFSKTWKFLISAVLSIFVGFFPSIMPDTLKAKAQTLFGNSYEIGWTITFLSISILLLCFSYSLWKNGGGTGNETRIKNITSGGSTKITSTKEGDFLADNIESEKSTNMIVSHTGEVSILGVKSKEDTIIDIKNEDRP